MVGWLGWIKKNEGKIYFNVKIVRNNWKEGKSKSHFAKWSIIRYDFKRKRMK